MPLIVRYSLPVSAFLLLFVAVLASEPAWDESPYRVRIYVSATEEFRLPREFARSVRDRCAVHWGAYWTVQIEEPAFELRERLRTEFADADELPNDWDELDKIFVADFSSTSLELREYDTATRWLGEKRSFPLGNTSKFEDVLIYGLHEVFSPSGRVEQSATDYATLSLRAKNLRPPALSIREDVFLPFLRSLDRDGKATRVDRIPWTVLLAEPDGSEFLGLRCRVESGVRSPLSLRRRGRTEIYALAVPTPSESTLLRFVPRSAGAAIGTLPIYSVHEKIPDENDAVFLGQTAIDGTFRIEPDADRAVRSLLIRDGTVLIARFPVVRGLETVTKIPVPDDVVRLEAEAALLGVQEEMIDQVARRDILKLRLKKYQEVGDEKQVREARGELLRMKDAARYHLDLNQLRSRLHSEDPIVERRINRLFQDTRKMVDEFLR